MNLAVLVIIESEGKILLYKRQNSGWEDGKFSVPSGRVESNETARYAVQRELKEEIDIEIEVNHLQLVHIEYTDSIISLIFKLSQWSGNIKNMEPKFMTALDFYDKNDLPQPIAGNGQNILEMIDKRILYSER